MKIFAFFLVFTAILRADIYIFGDSLSDTGNAEDTGLTAPPYAPGRFSNGPVWVEFLAEGLGFSSDAEPAIDGGNNFALGGAKSTDLETAFDLFFISTILTPVTSDDLFIIWIGGNDLLMGEDAIPSEVANNVESHIESLHTRGARCFLINNLPDLSQIPGEIGTPNAAQTSQRTQAYNSALKTTLTNLRSSLSGVTIYEVDIFSLFQTVTPQPLVFNFTNSTESAFDRDTRDLVSDPENYIFWDEIHPTTNTHQLIGEIALQALTNPDGIQGIHFTSDNSGLQASYIALNSQENLALQKLNSNLVWETLTMIPATTNPVIVLDEAFDAEREIFRFARLNP